jgi:solute carrier family 10 (sodium/bile acid cotransporter), member 7
MALAVLLAWLFPDPGAKGGSLHPELLTKLGVALIFFLHGVSLSFAALRAGTRCWPLHLVVQTSTFVLFPLFGLLLYYGLGTWVRPELRLGIFYLCALPSTVSSSVALTAIARGNVPAALFNATLSSLIGVLLTPLWVRWLLQRDGAPLPLIDVVLDLFKWLVLPLVLGQLLRPLLGAFAARYKKQINVVDRCTILLLVYTSFCDSVKSGVWSGHGISTVAAAALTSLMLFWAIFGCVGLLCQATRLNREDRIAALFCGSKKTLASGVPMGQIIFRNDPSLGLILLPIMIYHPLQLIICASLADRWARKAPDPTQT